MKIFILGLFLFSTQALAQEISMPEPTSTNPTSVSQDLPGVQEYNPYTRLPVSEATVKRRLTQLKNMNYASSCKAFADEYAVMMKEDAEKNKDDNYENQLRLIESYKEKSTEVCKKI